MDPLLSRAVLTMSKYLSDAMAKVSARQKVLLKCDEDQQSKLLSAGMADHLDALMNAIEANQTVLNELLAYCDLKPEAEEAKKRTLAFDHARLLEML